MTLTIAKVIIPEHNIKTSLCPYEKFDEYEDALLEHFSMCYFLESSVNFKVGEEVETIDCLVYHIPIKNTGPNLKILKKITSDFVRDVLGYESFLLEKPSGECEFVSTKR